MTPLDDDQLIDQLRSELAHIQADVSASPGIGDEARRIARRSVIRRTLAAGAPALAAAGVATVLLISGASPRPRSTAPHRAGHVPPAAAPHAESVDTAYIVRRVQARLVRGAQGTLYRGFSAPHGRETSNGSLVDLSDRTDVEYTYILPDGTLYKHADSDSPPGRSPTVSFFKQTDVRDRQTLVITILNVAAHTYSVSRYSYANPAGAAGAAQDGAPPAGESELKRALQTGRVTRLGTTTVDGVRAIALAVKQIRVDSRVMKVLASNYTITLYVDARTYQPLREVDANPSDNPSFFRGLEVSDFLPATPRNIALAENETIPAGYRRS